MKAKIFQHDKIARLKLFDLALDMRPDTIRGQGDRPSEKLGEPISDRAKGCFRIGSFGTTQVRGDDQPGAMVEGKPNRGKGSPDPGVILDAAGRIQRDIEVHPEKDSLAPKVQLLEGALRQPDPS
jgi:hypothetical protein